MKKAFFLINFFFLAKKLVKFKILQTFLSNGEVKILQNTLIRIIIQNSVKVGI